MILTYTVFRIFLLIFMDQLYLFYLNMALHIHISSHNVGRCLTFTWSSQILGYDNDPPIAK
jgi:hypothetical protein